MPPNNVPFFGPSYLQNIVFNNAPAILQFNGNTFGNWIAAGLPQYNADGSNADIFLTTPQLVSMFVGPPLGGVVPPPGGGNIAAPVNFNFNSIGLARATNDRTGGDVVFTFLHVTNYPSISQMAPLIQLQSIYNPEEPDCRHSPLMSKA
jgi:hypothetical protein